MKRTFGQPNDTQAVDAFPLGVWRPVGGVRSVRHMGLVEKVGPVRHTEARALQGDLPKSVPCSAYRSLSDLSESVLCSAYGSLSEACILFGVGRKRRNGARLHGFGNVLPGNATMGPFLGRIFFGSLFGKLCDLAFC